MDKQVMYMLLVFVCGKYILMLVINLLIFNLLFFKGQPYEGCTDEQVIQFIQEGSYLSIPEFCPPAVFAQMVGCFNENANRRPNFSELNLKFQVLNI